MTTLETRPESGKSNQPEYLSSFDDLVADIRRAVPLEGRLHPALDMLAAYDKDNQSDLLRTLDVYLENNCNAQKCGRLLFLHRNSLVYRIHRIQEITGCNLSDPKECSFLRLSFLLSPRS